MRYISKLLMLHFMLVTQIYSHKSIYLTIDDAPSRNTPKIIEYLKSHNIPAIFYCRGDAIEKYRAHVIEAIEEGFLIGNHSYSHPYFSQISLEECYDEILKTEILIDECYELAQIDRPYKIIRFPFGDKGAGPEINKPVTEEQKIKFYALQQFLKDNGFQKIMFKGLYDEEIDSSWSFDTQDYKKHFIKDRIAFAANLEQSFNALHQVELVLLMHDLNFNFHLFEITMDFLIRQEVEFIFPAL